MLQVWLDDSGKGQLPAFALAGYLGTVDDWMDFSDKWWTLLNEDPKLDYIKGYEAFGLRGEFKGWTPEDRDQRLLKFVPLIKKYSGKGFALMIGHEPFNTIVKDAPGTPFRTPYTFAYAMSLSTLLQLAPDINPKGLIDIVFDRDVIKRRQAENAYCAIFKVWPAEITSRLARREPKFEDDKSFVPLQAADMLAHCIRAYFDPHVRYQRVRESAVLPALREIPTALAIIGARHLHYMRSRVETDIPRQQIFNAVRW
jgi:hypothetical protein